MAKWITWVGDSTTPPSNHETITPAAELKTYASYEELPKAVKDALRIAHNSGLSVEQLHAIFDFPTEWIERAVKPHH